MSSSASKAPQAQEDPFASSFSASASSTSSSAAAAALRPPDYFQEKSWADSPMAMPARPAQGHDIPPTPGPSAVGRDHPWAKLLAGGDKGAAVPATPGGSWTPGGLLGGGNLSLPTTRRAPAPLRQTSDGFSKPNGVGVQLKDPRPSSSSSSSSTTRSVSNSTRNGDGATEFSSVPLTASLSLPVPAKKSGAGVSDDLSRFQGIECQTLASYLTDDGSLGNKSRPQHSVLVIDIRPSTSFAAGRVKSSINVCAPSTLLKRPGVTVQRIEDDMLQSEADRTHFCRWKSGPTKQPNKTSSSQSSGEKQSAGVDKIIVLDTDTASIGAAGRPAVGGGGPCLVGLLKKFDSAGFAGELMWLVGGYNRFAHYASDKPHLLERGGKNQTFEAPAGSRAEQANSAVHGAPAPGLSSRLNLPAHENSQSGDISLPTGSPSLVQRGLPMEAFTNRTTTDETSTKGKSLSNARDATDNQRTASVGNNSACNPFFDNIRQNRELQHGITERIPLEIGSLTVKERESLPLFLRRMVDTDVPDRAENLAQGFFEVEKAEQNRLMATMRQHASESSVDPRTASVEQSNPSSPPSVSSVSSSPLNCSMQLSSPYCRVSSKTAPSLTSSAFPFSIAAAVERGAENRYNNIWTYEHSRVKVAADDVDGSSHANGAETANSEYLNGSYVEPLREYGCHRSYIATQAPLPSTFETFWRAVWQQNSRTIAMLTREYESGRVQSHNYWSESSYGSTIKLRLLEERELNSRGMHCNEGGISMTKASSTGGGGFFADVPRASSKEDPVMILRKIELSYAGSNEPPRLVHHLQYIGWPDYTIPTDPEALLVFMDLASQCQHQAHLALSGGKTPKNDGMKWTRESATGPLMLHCSAGVGRTGTYAVVDSVLDVLRRERARLTSVMPLGVWDNGVTVSDGPRQPDEAVTIQDVEMIPVNGSLAEEDRSSRSLPQTPERRIKSVKNASLHPWPRAPSTKKVDGFNASVGIDPSVRSTRGTLRSSFSSNPTDSVDEGFSRSTRRSLKRELSPSAHMELDNAPSSQGGDALDNGAQATIDVPPPMRRNRSSSSDVALSTTSSSDTADSDFGPESSDSEVAKSRSGSLTSAAHPLPGWAHLGIRQPDGMDTPSRAMDGMSLGFNNTSSPAPSAAASARESPCPVGSASTDNKGSTASLNGLGAGMTSGYSQHNSGRRGSVAKQARSSEAVSSPQQAAAAAAAANASTVNTDRGAPRTLGRTSSPSPPQASSAFGDVDLVRRATDVAREQRMSSVQTQRQFVFCYSAVLKGFLRETMRGQGQQDQQQN